MTVQEIRKAINYGRDHLEDFHTGDKVPVWVVERFIELYEELVQKISDGE